MPTIIQPDYTTTGGNPSTDASGNTKVSVQTLLAGENQTFDRMFGGPLAQYEAATADELVKTGPGVYYGVVITTALSAHALEIRDATSAGSGTVIHTIPASAAVGNTYVLPVGVQFNTGLFVDFNASGTGTVLALYI